MIYLLITLFAFVIIFFCFIALKKIKSRATRKSITVKWDDVFDKIDSHPESNLLYNKLIRKCHPDRFPDQPDKILLAEDISSKIGRYKYDISELKNLEKIIADKLNV